ncbi:MAG: RIP metalloprotease RseP [Verrucomicrobia bacterium]|nr:RIP metalloprotease RseP [Verrucomicrobiota bacterium]
MSSDLLQTLASNLWAVFLVVLLFGGSIFVHELGHFLAARRRGVHVERFSIGFGPPIWSYRGRDGVDYRVSWIPLGGYVLLPQLADLGAIEGESEADVSKLPPISYLTKMIVFVAGAAFNILFALALACIVWVIGQPVASELSSTTVAEVLPTLKNADGKDVPSPASKAGLKPGDVIVGIDGEPVATFNDIVEHLALSSGWTSSGERETVFRIRRGSETIDLPIRPILGGNEKFRMIGFVPVAKIVVGRVTPGLAADRAGLRADDQIVAIDGKPVLTRPQLGDALRPVLSRPVKIGVLRAEQNLTLLLELPKDAKVSAIGLALRDGIIYAHPTPFAQVGDCIVKTFRTLGALLNPRSDIGLSHLSGPIGIISNFVDVSRAGLPFALWFTILVNVNLAIFNLLPIPVLDGGQMLFATIGRLRGRPLPVSFITTAQSVFVVLLFSMVLYVSVFDVRRIARDVKADRAAESAAKAEAAPPGK